MVKILQADDAFYFTSCHHRDINLRFRHLTDQYLVAEITHCLFYITVVHQQLSCFNYMLSETGGFPFTYQGPVSLFKRVTIMKKVCGFVVSDNVNDLRL